MSVGDPGTFDISQLVLRLATEQDQPVLRELFDNGVVEGHVPNNDTGADIDNIVEGYFSDGGQSAFWVADCHGVITGMIGVQKTGDNAAEVRRLRVRDSFRRKGIGTLLMEHALNFCREQGYLKITLDVRIERSPAISMFEKFGFVLSRIRELEGRKTLDFYLDLYRQSHHH